MPSVVAMGTTTLSGSEADGPYAPSSKCTCMGFVTPTGIFTVPMKFSMFETLLPR